jgi:hypothetical protein
MTNHYAITPSPELIETILDKSKSCREMIFHAYAIGAEVELENCSDWLLMNESSVSILDFLDARRPEKPPTLKEQALLQLDVLSADLKCDLSQIRRAVEKLPND